MSTKIQSDFVFQAGIHYQNDFVLNIYSISVIIYVDMECPKEQHIAMERMKHFFSTCLENSVFVNKIETDAIKKYIQANIKVCTLPNDPYDQTVAQALLLKLNSITEGRFVITELILSSKMSEGIKFFSNIEDVDDDFSKFHGWWFNSNTSISDLNKINKKEKIVQLQKPSDWDTDLMWEIKTPECITEEILFTNFIEKSPI